MNKKDNKELGKYLGKNVDTKNLKYSKEILVRHPRVENRKVHGIETIFEGIDVWRCYEASFLDEDQRPVTKVLVIKYSPTSEYIVESKSLKLYLFSLNNSQMSEENYLKTVGDDLTDKLETKVSVSFNEKRETFIADEYVNLDKEPVGKDFALVKSEGSHRVTCSNMRSNCRITGQPDFADIFIKIDGFKIRNLNSLIASYRNENHFHEEVIEMLFNELVKQGAKSLMVAGLFTRRGGIDINPVRYTGSIDKCFADFETQKTILTTIKQ